jgi:hypothetical protein
MTRRQLLAGLAVAAAAPGCASAPKGPVTVLGRPEWRAGDSWLFRRTPASGPSMMVTHEVIETTADRYLMRIAWLNSEMTRHWTRDLHVAEHTVRGRPLNRFDPPAMYFTWPLVAGQTWTQEFDYRDGQTEGHFANSWQVAPQPDLVDLMTGAVAALRIERRGGGGEPLDTYWYLPHARYWVKFTDHRNRYTEELVEARPGSA